MLIKRANSKCLLKIECQHNSYTVHMSPRHICYGFDFFVGTFGVSDRWQGKCRCKLNLLGLSFFLMFLIFGQSLPLYTAMLVCMYGLHKGCSDCVDNTRRSCFSDTDPRTITSLGKSHYLPLFKWPQPHAYTFNHIL